MRGVWVALCLVALAACSERAVSQDGAVPDVGWGPELSVPWDFWWTDVRPADGWWPDRDGALPPHGIDYVVSRLVLADTTTASKIGHDFDGDGTIDNALGAILGGLAQMGGGALSVQEAMDAMVNRGEAPVLLRLQVSSMINDPAASARTWLAAPAACCTTPQDPAQCAAQAKASCFSGGHAFQPDPADPQGSLLGGAIIGGSFAFGPGTIRLPLVMGNNTPVILDLTAARIKGKTFGPAITNGVLAGAIEQAQLNGTLVPAVAQMLNSTLQDPATDPQVKSIITSLFDMNQDGSITPSEVLNSTIIKTFLSGDKDVDNDGVKELTVGMGFEVVRAVITP